MGISLRDAYPISLSVIQLSLTALSFVGFLTNSWGEQQSFLGTIGLYEVCTNNGSSCVSTSSSSFCSPLGICSDVSAAKGILIASFCFGLLSSINLIFSAVIRMLNDSEYELVSRSSCCYPFYRYLVSEDNVVLNYRLLLFSALFCVIQLLLVVTGFGLGYHALVSVTNSHNISNDNAVLYHCGLSSSLLIISLFGLLPLSFLLGLNVAFTNNGDGVELSMSTKKHGHDRDPTSRNSKNHSYRDHDQNEDD